MNSSYLEELIKFFFIRAEVKNIEINSEANLERKLACFLEDNIPNDFKLETQKNIVDFGIEKIPNVGDKSEIDIALYNEDKSVKYAIELKYPHNIVEATNNEGGYKTSISEYIKDIYFTERLKSKGFNDTYVLIIVDNPKYYETAGDKNRKLKTDGLWAYFRGHEPITGNIICGKNKDGKSIEYDIKGEYYIEWDDWNNKKYYLCKIKF